MDSNDTSITEEISQHNGELNHTDKMIGIFTEPSNTFEHISKFPPRTKDWVIPLLLFFLIIALIRIIAMTNPEVYFEAKKQQVDRIEKMVDQGVMSRKDADEAIDNIDKQMEFMHGPVGWIISIVSILIFGFIIFFIITGIYFLLIKFVLKGEGGYSSALVASGLTAYIGIIEVIIAGICTMVFGKMVMDTSLAALLGSDKETIAGFFFAKIDPIAVWAYFVTAIGFAKMFKSESTAKYYALVFGVWIIGGLILFFAAKAVPFLGIFMQ